MNALEYIIDKWNVDISAPSPIRIPINTHRVELAKMFHELAFTCGAEVGTGYGGYATILCSNNKHAAIYCIDPWEAYKDFSLYGSDEKMDHNYHKTLDRLQHYKNVRIIRKYSMEALDDFEDGALDFVYIDANHTYDYVMEDMAGWSRKVRDGGIVAGHDYLEPPLIDDRIEVKEAVDEYTEAHNIEPWFVMGTPERSMSWLWIK